MILTRASQYLNISSPLIALALTVFGGCQFHTSINATHTVPWEIQVPTNVERLVILYPKAADPELQRGYSQLEGEAFRLKAQRAALKIIERRDLDIVLQEQQDQLNGAVSDETAVHVGRLLGADGVLIYRIEGLALRDRILASLHDEENRLMISSKIVRVENGEVLFHNLVTVPVQPHAVSWLSSRSGNQDAFDRAMTQTIHDLQHAFR